MPKTARITVTDEKGGLITEMIYVTPVTGMGMAAAGKDLFDMVNDYLRDTPIERLADLCVRANPDSIINAIKALREITGLINESLDTPSLTEAKELCEQARAELPKPIEQPLAINQQYGWT